MSNEEEIDSYYASQASYGSSKHHNLLVSKGYQQDPTLSSYNYRTYHKPDRTIVSYKGTNPLNSKDLKADLAIGFNLHRSNPDFKEASETAKKAKEKYKNQIVTTGHSLGGTKAIESAKDIGAKSVVFNPGTGLTGLNTGKHKVYINDKDIIASRVKGENVTKVKSKGYNPLKSHALDTFEDLLLAPKRPSTLKKRGKPKKLSTINKF